MNLLAVLAEAFTAICKILGLIQSEGQKQAGRDEINAKNAAAEAAASRQMEQIAVDGQTNEQTLEDLRRGDF